MATLPLLLEAEQFAPLCADPAYLIVHLGKESVYQQAHIPNAIWVNPRQLVSGDLPAAGKLPPRAQLEQLFNDLGIQETTQVIVYDDEGGAWAGRFIWTLDLIGHTAYAYLNGGLHAWLAAGLPIDNQRHSAKANLIARQFDWQTTPEVDLAFVLAHYQSPNYALWDARSPEEYTGRQRLAMRGGHIPHAVNYEWTQGIDKENALKIRPLDVIRDELAVLGLNTDKTIITYCQTHHRSGFSYLLGKLLGFNIKAYAGSWSEWANRTDTPIALD
ncbi:sulfurtransferase [Agitococcus lubricus]|uniref:Thiosulfate/3-mercaptopyruvate sulfurtransferase n=1 Tax=Agitococcus lubricus TaxID=1077255 RepID=A0A2T5IV64_9GAMM|nr:rhodanese-like domain-containing protein [Agitococcus lubricus]PTQ87697.1 thiosulfate/3-mercaptopyruvate sulfurtransferase [Agitococcus lubricus]